MKYLEIWQADLPASPCSHIQCGCRPVLVVSNDKANTYSPVISVVPLTSRLTKRPIPTHVPLCGHGLPTESLALCEQILTVDKARLIRKIGTVSGPWIQKAICRALSIQLNLVAA